MCMCVVCVCVCLLLTPTSLSPEDPMCVYYITHTDIVICACLLFTNFLQPLSARRRKTHGSHLRRRLFTLLYFTYPAIPLERGMGAGIGLYRHKHHAVITDVGF